MSERYETISDLADEVGRLRAELAAERERGKFLDACRKEHLAQKLKAQDQRDAALAALRQAREVANDRPAYLESDYVKGYDAACCKVLDALAAADAVLKGDGDE